MRNRRRQFIIEGNFQTRFMLRFIIVIVGGALLSAGALFGVLYFVNQVGGAGGIFSRARETAEGVTGIFQVVLFPVLISNFLILGVIIPYSLAQSHKIAGPIYRLEQSLELLLKGDMDFMITLRKKDEFKYLAQKMNAFIDFVRRNIGEVQLSHRVIQERVNKIEHYSKSDPPDLKAIRAELGELVRFFSERGKPFSY